MTKLFILDLDETLFHATETPLPRPPDFLLYEYSVYLRPNLHVFLEFCRNNFRVAVWTSAGKGFAAGIVPLIFDDNYPLVFVWSRERCTRQLNLETHEVVWLKDF